MDDQSLTNREITNEIEHGHDAYTDEELLEQAQFNAQALLLAAVAALDGDRVDAWTDGVAKVFLQGWDRDRAWEAAEVLDALLTNYRSFGAQVIGADLDATPATATVADLPDLELAESLGVPETHADVIFDVGARIADALGRSLDWSRVADTGDVQISVS